MFGDVTIKNRPLRLAFIVPQDKAVLRNVIQVNCTLWGGNYNPIIPVYKQAPKAWKMYPTEKVSVQTRVLGYINAFDPDVLVDCTATGLPEYLTTIGRRVIKLETIWSGFDADPSENMPKYGVGLFELLHAHYKEFFEQTRRFPQKIILPEFTGKHQLFWAATVGEYPEKFTQELEKNWAKAIDFERTSIDAAAYCALTDEGIFPRQVIRYHLRGASRGRPKDDGLAFFMDADQFIDIVDFWNLRALGRSVVPIPRQFAHMPEYARHIGEFVKESFGFYKQNPSISYGTTIIRSFSTEMSELQRFAETLDLKNAFPGHPNAHALSLQHWYPRIWDEWAMGKDGAVPDNVSCTTETISFPDTDGTISFKLLGPDFELESSFEGPRYANEIFSKFYGSDENIRADVLPYDHGKAVLRAAGGSMAFDDDLRIGRTGLIYLVGWRSTMYWKVALAEDVYFSWLKDKGFVAELSTCGRLAKEIHSQLGGWLYALTHEPVVKLIERMNKGDDEGKGLALGAVKNELKGVDQTGTLYRNLVRQEVFQLGYRTQCTHCGRASWYSVESLRRELICPLCHKELDAISAVDSENAGTWVLKMAGGLSVSNYADGGMCVLLALNFFERGHSLHTTPTMSFSAKRQSDGKELEADLGLIWQDTVFGESQEGVLFAECKSYNKFVKRDFDRMKILAEEFPGAVLAFCTLRRSLEPYEVKEIKKITVKGMKSWKPDRPINPVLILTGNELFNQFGPPICWDGLTVPEWAKRAHSLLDICNATQSMYLGLPHWHETWRARFEQRKKRQSSPDQ